MLDELRVAGDLLRLALDRYLNACLAIKRSSTEYPVVDQPQLSCPASHVVLDEVALLGEYETKLRESKAAILQAINLRSDVVPISKLPVDILVRIFQQLTNEEHEHAIKLSGEQKIAINKYPITLAHVCSNWRQIVLQTPLLWSYITLVCNVDENEQRLSCVGIHDRYSKTALVDVLVATGAYKIPTSTVSIEPFVGRIRSLTLDFPYFGRRSEVYPWEDAGRLLTRCLGASNSTLKRFVLRMHTRPKQPGHSFIEGISNHASNNHLLLDLPHDWLEDVLSSITNLWLRGHFFMWESKAYHGLTVLRLGPAGLSPPPSISELKLANILASSPQLQYIYIDLDITQEIPPPPPIRLSQLGVLVGDISLLQLISPGPQELSVGVIWQPGRSSTSTGILYSTRIKDFFSCANITRLLSHDRQWSSSASDVCYLLAMAPGVQVLALSHTGIHGDLFGKLTYPSLEALYLLDQCELDKSLFVDMVKKWNVKKIVLWGKSYILGSDWWAATGNEQSMEEELSDLVDAPIEFIPRASEDASAVDFFTSQAWA